MYSLFGLIILVLDIIAIVSILKSSADTGTKILWTLLVIFLPVIGMVLYFLMGPGRGPPSEASTALSEGAFPPTARRFESVGFSEIVKVRNRVMELLAAGQKVWRFEGGEPWMDSPEPVKAAMGTALVPQPDAVRALLGHPRAPPDDPREGPDSQRHPV